MIPVKHREYYHVLSARAQLIGRLLLEWHTQQALEYENKAKRYENEEVFTDNQMVYLLAQHASALQIPPNLNKTSLVHCLLILH